MNLGGYGVLKERSTAQRMQISKRMKEHNPMFNLESREKMRNSNKGRISPMKGKCHSEETRKKMSDADKGRTPWNKGKTLSPEYKEKLSEAHKGLPSGNKGKHLSEE